MASLSSPRLFLPQNYSASISKTIISISLIAILSHVIIVPCLAKNTSPLVSLSIALNAGKDTLVVPENILIKSMLGLLTVKDDDSGPGGNVTCRTESSYVGLIRIEQNTYKIELQNHLDREMIDRVDVVFLCSDQGSPPLATKAIFTLQITDVNDNDPIFTQDIYRFTLMENNSPDTEIGTVKAIDLDMGMNAMINYELADEEGNVPKSFQIDKDSGVITCTSVFDRESVSEVVMYAYSVDNGEPFLHDQAEIRIKIIDANDNSPIIISKNFSIDEAMERMSLVGSLKAMDLDEGLNSEVEFHLVTDGLLIPPFIVDPKGDIYAPVPLDRELRDQYVIQVSVTDLGTPPMSSTADITINVLDVNDNPPKIVSPKELDDFDDDDFSVNGSNFVSVDWYSPENDRVVYTVVASDQDIQENGRIFYSIDSINSQPVNDDSLFKIDQDTGHVSFRRTLRGGDDPVQLLTFLVYDGGNPSLNATASLNVTLDVDFTALTLPPPTQRPTTTTTNGPGSSADRIVIGFPQFLYGLGLFYLLRVVFSIE